MIINFEGFEDVNAFSDGICKDIAGYGTCAVITSTDGNTGPRTSGSGCFKGTSSYAGSPYANVWPRFALPSRSSLSTTEGTFGFAFYSKLVTNQAWSVSSNYFTPLVAVCDNVGRPHFFVGINASRQIHVARWLFNPATYVWNSTYIPLYYGSYGAFSSYADPLNVNSSSGGQNATLDSGKFSSLGYSSLSVGYNQVVADSWNYIEVQYKIDNASSGNTGFIRVKINRSAADATYDLENLNVRTSNSTNTSVGLIGFGQFMGSHTTETTINAGALAMVTYYDDIYWVNNTAASGTNPFNTFLGPITVRSYEYDTVSSNSFANLVGSDALTALSGKHNMSTGFSTYIEAAADGQAFAGRYASGTPAGIVAAVRAEYLANKPSGPAKVYIKEVYNGGEVIKSFVPSVDPNHKVAFANFENAADDTAWDNAKFNSTIFTITQNP